MSGQGSGHVGHAKNMVAILVCDGQALNDPFLGAVDDEMVGMPGRGASLVFYHRSMPVVLGKVSRNVGLAQLAIGAVDEVVVKLVADLAVRKQE